MKSSLRLVVLLLLTLLCSVEGLAQTITVPGPGITTIQQGIDAAPNGATVLVGPGTYVENIDFKGKRIIVTSTVGNATGAAAAAIVAGTIIDGSIGKNAAVSFVTGEGNGSVLNGFTVKNGGSETPDFNRPSTLAGIYISGAQPTISRNVLAQNHCHGIYSSNSSPVIEGNEINTTLDQNGTCSFAGGSAIWMSGTFSSTSGGNTVVAQAVVFGNLIQNNANSGRDNAQNNGGVGVAVYGGDVLIANNVIRNNLTGGQGAVFVFNTDRVSVIGNLIYGNVAGSTSAGLSIDSSGVANPPPAHGTVGPFIGVIANNTLYGNTLTAPLTTSFGTPATQVRLSGNLGQFILVNNVIAATQSGIAAVACGGEFNNLSVTPPVFDHNDIVNPGGVTSGGACPDPLSAYGNISVDPKFTNAAAGDFSLSPGSPAIDTGNNSVAGLPTTDVVGRPRIVDATGVGHPVIDMGAFEAAGVIEAPPTILELTPSDYFPNQPGPPPAGPGTGLPFKLTARLFSTAGSPAGPITFYEDLNAIGTAPTDGSGIATITPVGITPGVHAFYASYAGQGGAQSAVSVKVYVLFVNATPVITVTSTPNPSSLGSPATFTVKITSSDGTVPGPITLADNFQNTTTALGSPLTPDASGTATFTTSTLAVGDHLITASFAASPNENAATSAPYKHTVTAAVVGTIQTRTIVKTSLTPSPFQQPVTFTAQVFTLPGSSTIPTGTVTFLDGTSTLTTLQTVPLDASGIAIYTNSTLLPGDHVISAQYNPTGNFIASNNSVPQQIGPTPVIPIPVSNFTITLNPASVSIKSRQRTKTAVALTSIGTYSGTLALTAGPLPTYASAVFTPVTVSLRPGSTTAASLAIDTVFLPPGVALSQSTPPGQAGIRYALAAFLALPLLLLRRRRILPALLAAFAMAALLLSSSGCTNIAYALNTVAPGTYIIPVTATDTTTQESRTANFTLTVTP